MSLLGPVGGPPGTKKINEINGPSSESCNTSKTTTAVSESCQ